MTESTPVGPAAVARLRIHDIRSVWGPPLEVPLGASVTVLVGPNRAGASNVAWALVLAMDPAVGFRPGRDLPRGRTTPEPWVELRLADGHSGRVGWDASSGRRHTTDAVGLAVDGAHVVASRVHETPRDTLRRLPVALGPPAARAALAAELLRIARRVVPEVAVVDIDERLTVVVRDDLGSALPVPSIRAVVALGTVLHAADLGVPARAAVIEHPEAFLHPSAQEDLAALLVEVAEQTGIQIVVSTSSPFAIPRRPGVQVVALARDAVGRTGVVGSSAGDQPQARLLGGLVRDAGLAAVFDRVGAVPPTTRAVLVVEGGTDEAYLRRAAAVLGREDVLDDVVIHPSGGAMGAVLAAIVLRAELGVRIIVLLDHDRQGRRARDTLVSRFGFSRGTEVVTYADVFDGGPPGVEAESLFDLGLVRRFVAEQGPWASHGERRLDGLDHVELTSSGKSAFVGWLAEHADAAGLGRWPALFDLLERQLGARRS